MFLTTHFWEDKNKEKEVIRVGFDYANQGGLKQKEVIRSGPHYTLLRGYKQIKRDYIGRMILTTNFWEDKNEEKEVIRDSPHYILLRDNTKKKMSYGYVPTTHFWGIKQRKRCATVGPHCTCTSGRTKT